MLRVRGLFVRFERTVGSLSLSTQHENEMYNY